MVEDLYYKAMHYNFDGIRWEPTDVSFTNEEAGEAMNSVAVASYSGLATPIIDEDSSGCLSSYHTAR